MRLTPKICPTCQAGFQPKRRKQIYDTAKCRKAAWIESHPRISKQVIAKRQRRVTLEDLCPNNPAAVRVLADLIQAEARTLANAPSTRRCQRPGCNKTVRHDRDRFCSRAHDLADYMETIQERKQRRREKHAARTA
jgi:hypothetical protein